MEYENVNNVLLTREEACKKIKGIAESIEKIIKTNYLNVMSDEDKKAIKELYVEINETATANGVIKTAEAAIGEIKSKFGGTPSKPLSGEVSLDKFKGAIDAQAEATKNLKLKLARQCQGRANQIFNGLSKRDKAEACDYRRGKFEELTISLGQVKQNNAKISEKYKNCLIGKTASERKDITSQINTIRQITEKEKVGLLAERE